MPPGAGNGCRGGLDWMWADLQMTLPPREPLVSSAACALAIMMICPPRVPFQPGLAALPRAGSKPIDTVSCLPPEARGLAETGCHSLLLDPKEAGLLRAELGLVGLFSDPAVVRRAARYSDFLHQASLAGVITLDKYAEATVGIFFVAVKINNSVSLSIPDVSMCFFREPGHTALPTA